MSVYRHICVTAYLWLRRQFLLPVLSDTLFLFTFVYTRIAGLHQATETWLSLASKCRSTEVKRCAVLLLRIKAQYLLLA